MPILGISPHCPWAVLGVTLGGTLFTDCDCSSSASGLPTSRTTVSRSESPTGPAFSGSAGGNMPPACPSLTISLRRLSAGASAPRPCAGRSAPLSAISPHASSKDRKVHRVARERVGHVRHPWPIPQLKIVLREYLRVAHTLARDTFLQVQECQGMVVSFDHEVRPLQIAPPLLTQISYCQELTLSRVIVPFRRG